MTMSEWWGWAFGDREFFCFWWLRGLVVALMLGAGWWISDPSVHWRQLLVLAVCGAVTGALVWLVR